METNGDHFAGQGMIKKPKPLICKSWSENYEDVEVPGTPKTPRTSTTPGMKLVWFKVYVEIKTVLNALMEMQLLRGKT